MSEVLHLQGRAVGPSELAAIRGLIAASPQATRTALSQDLCRLWDWRTETGGLKDMAARSLMRRLDALDLIALPPPRRRGRGSRRRPVGEDLFARLACGEELSCALSEISPVSVEPAEGEDLRVLYGLLERHHYLGLSTPVGESLGHLARARDGRVVGGSLLGSAAWRCAARDAWIGWSEEARRAKLGRVACQHRFLIPGSVRVPHLASHVLGRLARRASVDFEARYGRALHLLETFVEPRFAGTCYRAAGWIDVGETTGRSRNGRPGLRVSRKRVFVRPVGAGLSGLAS